jgi:hypothetical protein
MRNLNTLNRWRVPLTPAIAAVWGVSPFGDETCGCFAMRSPIDRKALRVIASAGEGWDHVSVSRVNSTPKWAEMCFIKNQFFGPDETAMQLHVPVSDHISHHDHCLHLWRPHGAEIPRPPWYLVGPRPQDGIPRGTASMEDAERIAAIIANAKGE